MRLRDLFGASPVATAPKTQPALPVGLQVLFPTSVVLAATPLARMLAELHPSLARVRVEIKTGELSSLIGTRLGTGLGQVIRAQWGRHAVLMALIDTPIHADTLEWTLQCTHQDEATRQQAQVHKAYAALSYSGEEKDPLEQYVALGLIAMAMARVGAQVVLNASAYSLYPSQILFPRPGEDAETVLRNLPLTALFVGFARFTVEGTPGVWMRTCGAPVLDLPDLALHAHGIEQSFGIYTLFNGLFKAMRSSQVRFSAGDTLADGDKRLQVRAPRANEGYLDSPRMIVLEPEGPADWLT